MIPRNYGRKFGSDGKFGQIYGNSRIYDVMAHEAQSKLIAESGSSVKNSEFKKE